MVTTNNKIKTEQTFADAVYRDFKSRRFGITNCCFIDLTKAKLRKEICDWDELKEVPVESVDCTGTLNDVPGNI